MKIFNRGDPFDKLENFVLKFNTMKRELGKHFLNISLVFLGGVFIQAAFQKDWETSVVGLGLSVFFTCLGAAILKGED